MNAAPSLNPKPGSRNLRRTALRLLLISIVTITVTLGMIEIVVRVAPLYPHIFYKYDPVFGWRHVPNMNGTYLYVTCLGEYSQTVPINSLGLRDVEHTYDDFGVASRVWIAGDSLAAGFEVSLEQTFFRQAETRLNDNPVSGSVSFEVINGGHQGYNTAQSVILYEREGIRYAPDVVILMFETANDVTENSHLLRYNGSTYYPYFELDDDAELVFHEGDPSQIDPRKPPVNIIHDNLYNLSFLYRLLYDRLSLIRGVMRFNEATGQQSLVSQSYEITAALIRRFRQSVEANGARFGVIIAPLNWERPGSNTAIWEWLAQFLTDEGIPFRNPQPLFDSVTSEEPLFYSCDKYHWRPAGHALMADVLADLIVEFAAG